MLIIPAIDLKDGKVVRLLRGKYEDVTIYSQDPAEIAKDWQAQGALRLHVIDLDGAMHGEVKNIEALRQIIKAVDLPVEFGGGLRKAEDIAAVIAAGANWAILGTRGCEDLDFTRKVAGEFKGKIIVSVDVRNTKVATCGWMKTSAKGDVELIKELQEAGIETFVYTDISRDGALAGINIEGIERVLEKTGASIIYSGGVSSLEDVRKLKSLEKQGLKGVIIGKALYENRISLSEAKRIAEEKS